MTEAILTPKKIFELAREAGCDSHAMDANSLIVRHSNGSWISVEGILFRFAELVKKELEKANEEKLPPWKRCEHKKTTAKWGWIQCDDCRAIRTGSSGWGLAKNMWFPNPHAAEIYDKTGRMPDEVQP
jgi:hypothetical protein